MTRIRIATVTVLAAIGLAACGGVDRDGTRDEIVSQLSAAGIEIDGDCIDAALDKYSDDELEAIDEALGEGSDSDAADALMEEIFSCVPTGS